MVTWQLSVFLENRAGRMAEVISLLEEANIRILAVSLADATDFGILRLVVDEPKKAQETLCRAGLAVRETEILIVSIPDRRGGLSEVLRLLREAAINIEYLYSFTEKPETEALMVIRTDHNPAAARRLIEMGIQVIGSDNGDPQ
jgi:hypothetical protein